MSKASAADKLKKLIGHSPVGIRVATSKDRNRIEHVYRASGASSFLLDEAEWNRWINSKGLLVAEINDRIVGFGGIDVNAKEQLKWLFLLPEFQGRGIGSKLLEELEEVGWRCGLRSIRLHSTPPSEMFYRKAGYAPVAVDEVHHDHDGIEMIKIRRDVA
jgi:GNAT superfamily N-acetyltransferase